MPSLILVRNIPNDVLVCTIGRKGDLRFYLKLKAEGFNQYVLGSLAHSLEHSNYFWGKKKNSSAYSNFMLESKQHMKEGIRLEDKILESRWNNMLLLFGLNSHFFAFTWFLLLWDHGLSENIDWLIRL